MRLGSIDQRYRLNRRSRGSDWLGVRAFDVPLLPSQAAAVMERAMVFGRATALGAAVLQLGGVQAPKKARSGALRHHFGTGG